jgi:hypothetical protein
MSQQSELREAIESAINRHSAENGSDTPDFILARYLTACLEAFDAGVNDRDKWYGRGRFDALKVSSGNGPVPVPKEE